MLSCCQFALERLPRSKSHALYSAFTKFEKQHGNKAGVESTVLGKRRIQYEEEIADDANNYVRPSCRLALAGALLSASTLTFFSPHFKQDAWISYARLEEDAYRSLKADRDLSLSPDKVRDVYERAVAQVPPAGEKRFWRRYIFLWLFYAAFEEVETKVRL